MSDAVEDLIGEVARKHGIAIGRDDPILVLHTIHIASTTLRKENPPQKWKTRPKPRFIRLNSQ